MSSACRISLLKFYSLNIMRVYGRTSILFGSTPSKSGMITIHSYFPAGGGGSEKDAIVLVVVENWDC